MSKLKRSTTISSISTLTPTKDKQEGTLLKNFSWWSLLGVAFSLTNSWLGISTSLVVGLSSGGPVLIIYGLIIAVFFTLMCGYSLSEFASLLPNSSGSSFWVLKLLQQEKKFGEEFDLGRQTEKVLFSEEREEVIAEEENTNDSNYSLGQIRVSLAVGMINYFGSIFTTASVCSSLGYSILGAYSLYHPLYVSHKWHIFVIYEILNILIGTMNCWGEILPTLSQIGLYASLLTYCLTFVVSLACRSYLKKPWPSTTYIFKEFKSTTGWSSRGLSFIVGLINPLWAFAGIDSATHMVDEVGQAAAASMVPKAIMTTIIIGFITSFTYSIGMFYCITDADSVVNSILPIIEIYYQATENKALAVFLQSCCIFTGFFCGIASGTWQSRILWSIGRDYGAMISRVYSDKERSLMLRLFNKFASIHPALRIPLWSVITSHFFVAIIGCVLLGSTTAFNAIITACICLLLLSYSIPTGILLLKGKKKFFRRIISELGRSEIETKKFSFLSYIPNVLTICWTVFCFVFLSFPYELPVSSSNMNYVSAAYGGVAVVVISIVFLTFR